MLKIVECQFNRGFIALLALGALIGPASVLANGRNEAFRPTVYVYSDSGACPDGCITAVLDLAHSNGYRTVEVRAIDLQGTNGFINPRVGDLWIQPGGDAVVAARAIGVNGIERLRHWVGEGMNYLGFCAGAFLADSDVDDADTLPGLGLIPFQTENFLPGRHESMILNLSWNGQSRWLYFQDGPTFTAPLLGNVELIASYANHLPAVIQTQFGKGRVVLSGVHPEAPADWARDDHLYDPDGVDTDLANELFVRAMGDPTAVSATRNSRSTGSASRAMGIRRAENIPGRRSRRS